MDTVRLKPVRIFRHQNCDAPGYLGDYLDSRQVPWELVCIKGPRDVPTEVGDVSGLVFLGAMVSVNDDLDWIESELKLIRQAIARGVPVLGVCFGAQLMSKALGGRVMQGKNGMEIGWYPLSRSSGADESWLGGLPKSFDTFHWHADTFTLPQGSSPLLQGKCFSHQAFTLGDNLAIQFHLEMTERMVRKWVEKYGSDLRLGSACAQDRVTLYRDLPRRIEDLHKVSDVIYGSWVERVLKRSQVNGKRSNTE